MVTDTQSKMVRLTMDLIIRGTSGYAKKKRDESTQHFIKRLTHLYLEDKNIDEVVRSYPVFNLIILTLDKLRVSYCFI